MDDVTEDLSNPLLLPEILNKIFGYLCVAHLKKCRLVNWAWNNVTNRVMKTKGGRMVGFSYGMNGQPNRFTFNRIRDMRTFLEWVERTKEKTEFPITRIPVRISFDPMDAELFQAVAPFVEELWIQLDVRRSLPESESPLFRRIDYPALKKLRLIYINFSALTTIESRGSFGISVASHATSIDSNIKQKADTRGHDRFLATLFSSAPTLESFSVNLDWYQGSSTYLKTMRKCFTSVMRGLRFGYKVRTLKEFETALPYDNRSLMRLSNMKLSTLKIQINRTTVNPTTFRDFLESQSESLKALTIKNAIKNRVEGGFYHVHFPEMTALQSLTVEEHESRGHVEYRNISYRKQFPALKQITFLWADDAVGNFYRAEDTSDTVTELRLKDGQNLWRDYWKYDSHEVFPNLRKLEIRAKKFAMIYVFKNLPLLEHLTLYDNLYRNHLLDLSLFGCDCSSCSDEIHEPCRNREYLDDGDRKLSIASLSHLKTLRLSSPGDAFLEDIAGRRIMTCPSLERVVLETRSEYWQNMVEKVLPSQGENYATANDMPVSNLMLKEMRTKFQVEILTYVQKQKCWRRFPID